MIIFDDFTEKEFYTEKGARTLCQNATSDTFVAQKVSWICISKWSMQGKIINGVGAAFVAQKMTA